MTEASPPPSAEPDAHIASSSPRAPRAGVARELIWVFVAITLASVVISRVGASEPLSQYVHVAIATLYLWSALHFAQRDARGVQHYGLSLGGFFGNGDANRGLLDDIRDGLPSALRELAVASLIALIVFPPFALAFSFWHGPTRAFTPSLPQDLASFMLAQALVVALPEEALFRGYFQTRCADLSIAQRTTYVWRGRRWPLAAIVIQAALFALVHFAVDLDVTRLSVFFPGLLFGVLRAWRGGIGAAVFFHALCNLWSDVLVRGWL